MIDVIIPLGELSSLSPEAVELANPQAQSIRLIEIGAIAGRMGVGIDVAGAVSRGLSPEAVAAAVFAAKAEAEEATAIISTLPTPTTTGVKIEPPKRSGIIVEAQRSAAETLAKHQRSNNDRR